MPAGPTLPSHRVSTWLFLRGLGLVYFIAFVSFATQARGLVGPDGILPLAPYLHAVAAHVAHPRCSLPTLSWLDPDRPPLLSLAVLGAALSVGLMLGFAPWPSLALLWLLYLSVTCDGQIFMDYQWDGLLLECGLAALCVAPWTWRSRLDRDPEPPRAGRRLLAWLLFRLVFASGVVKLASGDPTWRSLEALRYHWWTQPLPVWTSWYLNRLPDGLQRAVGAAVLALELGVPWLIVPPATRRFAAWGIAGLMVLIETTGNYGFFNMLTAVLCLALLRDQDWPARLLRPPAPSVPERAPLPSRARRLQSALAITLFSLSAPLFLAQMGLDPGWPAPLWALERAAAPLRSVNTYGLFAVMTTQRLEITVEGSDDGVVWKEYKFPWKPGDVLRRPGLVAPFQPRLDWQLWFAALEGRPNSPWFENLLERLREGSPAVLGLLSYDPFPKQGPRYLRAWLYDYRFTDAATRAATGAWWRRTLVQAY